MNRSLSEEEIEQAQNRQVSFQDNGLVNDWPLHESTGTDVRYPDLREIKMSPDMEQQSDFLTKN